VSRVSVLGAPRVGGKLLSGQRARVKVLASGVGSSGVAASAEASWKAALHKPGLTPQWLKDQSGNGHHMRLGSAGRGDVVGGELVLPQAAGSYARVDAPANPSLVPNGTFEVDTVPWANAANATLARDTVTFRTGIASLKLTAVALGAMTATVPFASATPCVAGQRIYARAWWRAGTTARTVRTDVRFLDGVGATISTVAGLQVNDSNAAWTMSPITATVPVGAVFYVVRLAVTDAATAAAEVHYVDDVDSYVMGDLDAEGDAEWVVLFAPDTLTGNPAAARRFFNKRTSNTAVAWDIHVSGSGQVVLTTSVDGTTSITHTFSALTALTGGHWQDGMRVWLRIRRDADNVSRADVCTADWAPWTGSADEPTVWTVGSGVASVTVPAAAGPLYLNTAPIELGGRNFGAADPFGGRIKRAIFRRGWGVAAPVAMDIDFSVARDGAPYVIGATGKRCDVYPLRAVVLDKALYVPGSTSQYLVSPAHSSWNVAGDFEFEWEAKPLNIALSSGYVAIRFNAIADAQFGVQYTNTGVIQVNALRTTGVWAGILTAPAVTVGPLDGLRRRFKVTVDIDNGAGSLTSTLYEFVAGAWVQLHQQNTAGTSPLFVTSAPLTVGSWSGGQPFLGHIYQFTMRDGIGGPAIFDADFSTWSDGDGYYPRQEATGKWVRVVSDATGADTNDPSFYPYKGEKYARLQAGSTQISATIDTSKLAAGLVLKAKVAMDDYSPASTQVFMASFPGGGFNTFRWGNYNSGQYMYFEISPDGTAQQTTSMTSQSLPVMDGQLACFMVTRLLEGGVFRVKHYIGPTMDGPWTLLQDTSDGVNPIFNAGLQTVTFGSQGTSFAAIGDLYEFFLGNGTETLAHLRINDTQAPYIYHSPTPNLLDKQSSDFEGGLGRWTEKTNATVAYSTAQAASGVGALRFTAVAAGGTVVESITSSSTEFKGVSAGRLYTAMAKVRSVDVVRDMHIQIDFRNSAGTYLGSGTGGVVTLPTTTTDWTLLRVETIAPADAIAGAINVGTTTAAAGNRFDLDEAGIFEGSVALWSAGGTPFNFTRAATGKKFTIVDRPLFLFGTDDYGEVADHAALDFAVGESFSITTAQRMYNTLAAGSGVVLSKANGFTAADVGYLLYKFSNTAVLRLLFQDGALQSSTGVTPNLVEGIAHAHTTERDVPNDLMRMYWEGVATSASADITTATTVNAHPLRFGRNSGAGTNYADMEWYGGALHRSVVSLADSLRLKYELGAA